MALAGNEPIFIFCLLLSLFAGLLCDKALKHTLTLERTPKTACIGMIGTAVFLCVHGFTCISLMSALVIQVLLFASVYDIKTHTVPNYVHILILLAGLLRFQFFPALLGFLLVPLPLYIAFRCNENGMGAGDIKLMAACGFVLGVRSGISALICGLAMSAVWNLLFNKAKKPFALIPHLAFGCFIALIQI